jgi:tetratricopeptide (TPR) repeat protein
MRLISDHKDVSGPFWQPERTELLMDEIERLIKKGSFWWAERRIRKRLKTSHEDARAYYLWGLICEDYRNPARSVEKAREYFERAIKGDNPVEDAFLSLASLETSTGQKIRILRRGIQKCPRSRTLYRELLDWSTDEDSEAVFKEMIEKRILSIEAVRIMAGKYFMLGKLTDACHLLSSLKGTNQASKLVDDLLYSYCLLGCGNISNALAGFESLASVDVTHNLGYAALFGLVICHLEAGKYGKALDVFNEVPEDADFSPPYDERLDFCLYNAFIDHVTRATSGLLKATRDKDVLAKARGIRALVDCWYCGSHTSRVVADLKAADKRYPANKRYCNELRKIMIQQSRWRDAYTYTWRYLWSSALKSSPQDQADIDFSFVHRASEEDFLYMLEDIKRRLQDGAHFLGSCASVGTLLDYVIQRLWKGKRYDGICALAGMLPEELVRNWGSTFSIAYAYNELGDLKEAERYYRICETRNPLDSAVANNLGCIYEQDGDYATAKEYYQSALKLSRDNDLYKNNLSRLIDFEKAAPAFREESRDVKRCVLALWRHRDPDGHICATESIITNDLRLSRKRAGEMMRHLIAEHLLVPVHRGTRNRVDMVHRVNPHILTLLSDFEVEFEHSEAILGVATGITPEALSAIGYSSDVINALKRISSTELQSILKRDLREAALSFLAKCFKTTLILCGSMTEAILLDRILAKNLKTYESQNRGSMPVQKMALDDLLHVAKSEKIIDEQTYHLAHALRGFRNLIHPGVEQRKDAIAVSEQNARIAWTILRKLVIES